LKYFDDFEQRIPRAEMLPLEAKVQAALQTVDERLIGNTVGSYRRGAASSGDIDFLITHPEYTTKSKSTNQLLERIVEQLQRTGFITDTLSVGAQKFMGVCKLQDVCRHTSPHHNQ
jgi:DNA polymerase beta